MTRTWLAVGLEALFFALAFGLRSWLQWRRTGSTGFIRPRRGAPPLELAGAFVFTAALVLLVAAPVAELAGLDRIDLLDNAAAAVGGTALAALGIAATLWAQLAMGDSWRIGVDPRERTALVTVGPFGLVRNPIFTAMLLATAGLVLLVPNLISVAAIAALWIGLEVQVRGVEEPYLRSVHGDRYDSYARRAGRFLPRIG